MSACRRLGTALLGILNFVFMRDQKPRFSSCFAVIALLSLAVYYPSFSHAPRADQVAYLAETSGQNDWFTLAIKSYALNRTRKFIAGDEILFRPVHFFALGTEKCLYGYHFPLWQITSFVLHLCVVGCLLKVLLLVREGIFAPLLAAFFSVLYVGMEMVIWHHLHAYLIFVIFALAALYNLHLYFSAKPTKTWRLWAAVICLLVASFSFEVGAAYSLVFAAYSWIAAKRSASGEKDSHEGAQPSPYKPALILLIPFLAYVIASGSDYLSRGKAPVLHNPVAHEFRVGKTVGNVVLADIWWSYTGVFPSAVVIKPEGRLRASRVFAGSRFLDPPFSRLCFFVISIYTVLVYLVILKKTMSLRGLKARWPLLVWLMSLLLVYSLMIAVARLNLWAVRGFLGSNLYYAYIFWAFFVIFIYALVDFENPQGPQFRKLKYLSIGLLLMLVAYAGVSIREMNLAVMESSKPELAVVQDVEALIKKHGAEEDFSFSVPVECPGNPVVEWLWKSGDPPEKRYAFAEALYLKYYREKNPRYLVGAENQIKACIPELLKTDYKGFAVYRCGLKFYALARNEGALDIGKVVRKEYKRVFVGNSKDELKKLIDQSLEGPPQKPQPAPERRG
jgi:hypothetical protein